MDIFLSLRICFEIQGYEEISHGYPDLSERAKTYTWDRPDVFVSQG